MKKHIDKSITKTIAIFKELRLEMYVPLYKGGNFISETTNADSFNIYHNFKMNSVGAVIFKIKNPDDNLSWDKQSLLMHPTNQSLFMDSMLKFIETESVITVNVYTGILMLYPNDSGVILYINSEYNKCYLTEEEFRALVRIIKNIDIFLYSQSLINTYLLCKINGIEDVGKLFDYSMDNNSLSDFIGGQ